MITCRHHDTIEIACMHRLSLTLFLRNGDKITGVAVDTALNDRREECIRIKAANGYSLVVLDDLYRMQATTPNPYFERIDFDGS